MTFVIELSEDLEQRLQKKAAERGMDAAAYARQLIENGLSLPPQNGAELIAYWEAEGVIPRPTREWRGGAVQAIYPIWMAPVVRTVRGMQAQGATLAQIRKAVKSTPWRTPMAPPGWRRRCCATAPWWVSCR